MSTHEFSRREFLAAGAAVGTMAVLPSIAQAAEKTKGADASAQSERKLTLHAIDTYFGQTRPGLRIDLSVLDGDGYRLLKTVETEPRGRTKEPLLVGDELKVGRYELLLHLDEYFEKEKSSLPQPPFLSKVPIRFGVYEEQRFHVPILFSPWSYSYYRGS